MGDGEGLYKQCLGREEKGVEVSALNLPKTQTFNEQKNEWIKWNTQSIQLASLDIQCKSIPVIVKSLRTLVDF